MSFVNSLFSAIGELAAVGESATSGDYGREAEARKYGKKIPVRRPALQSNEKPLIEVDDRPLKAGVYKTNLKKMKIGKYEYTREQLRHVKSINVYDSKGEDYGWPNPNNGQWDYFLRAGGKLYTNGKAFNKLRENYPSLFTNTWKSSNSRAFELHMDNVSIPFEGGKPVITLPRDEAEKAKKKREVLEEASSILRKGYEMPWKVKSKLEEVVEEETRGFKNMPVQKQRALLDRRVSAFDQQTKRFNDEDTEVYDRMLHEYNSTPESDIAGKAKLANMIALHVDRAVKKGGMTTDKEVDEIKTKTMFIEINREGSKTKSKKAAKFVEKIEREIMVPDTGSDDDELDDYLEEKMALPGW